MKKKKSVVCEEERKTSKLNSFFMGLYFPPYSLNSGWEKKKSALITGIITFIFLKLNFGYTEEMAWGGMENTVWND